MKRYGIIGCLKCKTYKIIETAIKSTTCNRCGKKIIINKNSFKFTTDSQEEARIAIGILNEEQDKKKKPYQHLIATK